MKKQILSLGTVLSKKEQKLIIGKGGLAEDDMGVCIVNGRVIVVPCDSLCPNGTQPICSLA